MLAALALAGAASAQAPSGPEALTLESAVRATLATDPEILLAAQRAEAARGAMIAAAAPFDLAIDSQAGAGRTHSDPAVTPESTVEDASVSAGAERLFRNGVGLSAGVSLLRQDSDLVPGPETPNRASVGVSLRVPLLKDRGGRVSASVERAARSRYEAAVDDLRHAVALRVLAVAVAFWDYVAAQENLQVLAASEERALRTVDETRVLVTADERTAADLNQLEGNQASKRLARTAAQQSLVVARQQLGLAMGIAAEAIAALPPPATAFPALSSQPSAAPPLAVLVDEAVSRRADLASAERLLRAAGFDLAAARSDLSPQLDLVLGTGYDALERGLGAGAFVGPLYRRQPRLDATVALRYRFPLANSGARGRHVLQQAAHEQQRIVLDELRRRIAVGLASAASALVQADLGSRAAEDAVRFFQSGVEAERRKFQLGATTLFDLIQAQDALTNALLGRIQSRRDHAVAIASLRFQRGVLVDGGAADPAVDVGRLQEAP